MVKFKGPGGTQQCKGGNEGDLAAQERVLRKGGACSCLNK